MTFQRIDTIILGAGIGGLTCGLKLAQAGQRVLIAEPRNAPGGVIRTHEEKGFLLENGPNSFTSFPAEVMDLVDEVGLSDVAYQESMRENDRFIWYTGKLRKVGPGVLFMPGILTIGEKLKAVRGVFKKVPPPQDDLTLGEFFGQRVGRGVVEKLLKPFMAGVYAADADRVSFETTFNKMYKPAQQSDSIRGMLKVMKANRKPGPRPKKALVSFPEGLQQFPARIADKFEEAGGELRLGAQISLARSGDDWKVTIGEEEWEAPNVVLAMPAYAAAEKIEEYCPEGAEILRAIEYAPLTVAHVGLREEQLRESRNGFGFLSVDNQGVRALGMIWSNRIFPNRAPAGQRLLTMFYGGEKDPAAMKLSDEELRQQLSEDLQKTMGFTGGDFSLLEFTRWDRALPIFRVGHMRKIEKLDEISPAGLSYLGNWRGGVSIPDRVVAAMNLAAELANEKKPEEALTA